MAKKQNKTDAAATAPKRLLLLDTHAIMHRAYHAIPDLSSSKGEPTGALFGLVTMLVKSIADLKPDYIVAARDRKEKTHRHEVYADYKGTRAKTEDALIEQLNRTGEVFDAFGIPALDVAGFEADDVVGTVAEQVAGRKDLETIILTGDMDMLQLIHDGRVTVYRLLTGISNMKFYDEEAVKERYGFGPEHVTDFKGISGDSSDNIKGVPGVGEGGASKLIQTFGGLDDIYNAIRKEGVEAVAKKAGIQKRYVQLVVDNEESARFSKSLATIRRDAPITFVQPDHPWRIEDHITTIDSLCDALEFRSLKGRLRSAARTEEGLSEPSEQGGGTRQEVDAAVLEETSVALWLLRSDLTSPTFDDILQYAEAKDFETARTKIFAELKKTGRLADVYDHIEKPLIPVIHRMNETGIYVDISYLSSLSREYGDELSKIAARIYAHAGREFNINSPKQLGDVLYDELQITPVRQKKTATGARTTREEELAKMAHLHPVIADVLAYRELQKLLSTYIDKIPALIAADKRLHAEFLQAGTTTGRMSSKEPNLQNIPIRTDYGKRIRRAFAAQKGFVLASIDYSQIELRIAAGLSGDENLVRVFKEHRDVHTEVAARVFGVPPEDVDYEMRRRAKVINFGILYGMGVNALRANLGEGQLAGGGVSRDEAAKYLDDYFKSFSGLASFIEKTKADAARLGYTETLFGRRRYFSGFKSTLPNLRAQAERMAVNAPIQGTQADIIKRAMVEADSLIEKNGWRGNVRLLLQVHDELVYEVDEREAEMLARTLRDVMERVVDTKQLGGVPIVAEIALGANWGEVRRIART
jgi:DNA polymerase-1